METASRIQERNSIRQRVRDTQAGWSPHERRRRAEEGRRRRAVLFSLIAGTDPEEVWAVGAPVVDD